MVYCHVSFWGVPWVSNPFKKITFTKQIQRETVTRCSKQNPVTRCSFWQGHFPPKNWHTKNKTQSFQRHSPTSSSKISLAGSWHMFFSNDVCQITIKQKNDSQTSRRLKSKDFLLKKSLRNSSLQKTVRRQINNTSAGVAVEMGFFRRFFWGAFFSGKNSTKLPRVLGCPWYLGSMDYFTPIKVGCLRPVSRL